MVSDLQQCPGSFMVYTALAHCIARKIPLLCLVDHSRLRRTASECRFTKLVETLHPKPETGHQWHRRATGRNGTLSCIAEISASPAWLQSEGSDCMVNEGWPEMIQFPRQHLPSRGAIVFSGWGVGLVAPSLPGEHSENMRSPPQTRPLLEHAAQWASKGCR